MTHAYLYGLHPLGKGREPWKAACGALLEEPDHLRVFNEETAHKHWPIKKHHVTCRKCYNVLSNWTRESRPTRGL